MSTACAASALFIVYDSYTMSEEVHDATAVAVKPARPPGVKKPAGPPGAKKAAGPPGAKKPAGPGAKLPPGYAARKKKKKTKSDVEGRKEGSNFLYTGIPETLAGEDDHFAIDQKEVLKHCGIYQQDDRDQRKQPGGKHYYFFVRSKLPGGKLTAEQYLVHDRLADDYGIGSLRITTRQGIQIHGVVKDDLKLHLKRLNEALVTTLGACGDVVRNTMCCPAPTADPLHREIQAFADEISAFTIPSTPAYHDVWLKAYDAQEEAVETIRKIYDGRKARGEDFEPFYGKAYLPRKFKVGIAYPGDNCVDVYTHDVGLIAVEEDGTLAGFNVLVGGGLGNTHNKPKTYPRLADDLGYVPKDEALDVVEAVIVVQRDHGNRKDRKQARLKYLIDDWGLEKSHHAVADRFGRRLDPPADIPAPTLELHHGWNAQGDGRYYLGLSIENGRIQDEGDVRIKTGLRKVVERFAPGVRLTPSHDLLLTGLHARHRPEIEAILEAHGIPLPESLSNTQKYAMACPALPTCGLALTESERIFPAIIDEVEAEADRLGLGDEAFSIRMTGCPNGCARPYVADIGVVGQSLDKYKIYVGGSPDGTRLNVPFADLVDTDEIVPTIRRLLRTYKQEGRSEEPFGDFCHRVGIDALQSLTQEEGIYAT